MRDQDADIIRLTSLFTARKGRDFLTPAIHALRDDPAFAFLTPTHPHFPFFRQLCDVYGTVLAPPANTLPALTSHAENPTLLLAGLSLHAQHAHRDKLAKLQEMLAEATEADLAAQVDWTSFAVLEEVDFDPAEDAYLPDPQFSIAAVEEMVRLQDVAAAEQLALRLEQEREAAARGDDDDDDGHRRGYLADDTALGMVLGDDDEQLEVLAAGGAPAPEKPAAAPLTQRCPMCGSDVPVEELQHHMRVELLDPRWREHKKAEELQRQVQAGVSSTELTANIARLLGQSQGPSSLGADWKTITTAQQQQQQQQTRAAIGPTPGAPAPRTRAPPPPGAPPPRRPRRTPHPPPAPPSRRCPRPRAWPWRPPTPTRPQPSAPAATSLATARRPRWSPCRSTSTSTPPTHSRTRPWAWA
jgi:splicing factor 3A subunit 1